MLRPDGQTGGKPQGSSLLQMQKTLTRWWLPPTELLFGSWLIKAATTPRVAPLVSRAEVW